MSSRARLIAFYLPQYHPIPENDEWWGKGFTDWIFVSRARPLFPGHNQPRLPTDLGFYDLRVPEVREAQAELARRHGIHGFCYYYYWFENGKQLLERPLEEVLSSGKPDFPFCLCWANENWTRRWDGQEHQVLMRQDHSPQNDLAFLHSVLPYMRDPRYIRVAGRPLLMVYRANLFPDMKATVSRWRDELRRLGEADIYLIAAESFDVSGDAIIAAGFDALCEFPPHQVGAETVLDSSAIASREPFSGTLRDYAKVVARFLSRPAVQFRRIRTVMLEWDNTARRMASAHVTVNYSVPIYYRWLKSVLDEASRIEQPDERLVFINAWNEWAEGTYLEPDSRHGLAPLEATMAALEGRAWDARTAAEPQAAPATAKQEEDAAPSTTLEAGISLAGRHGRLRLVALTMMANEADIAETFVRLNLRFVDCMYIVLNNAHDGTADILQALRDEGLPLIISSSPGTRFDHLEAINRVLRQALTDSSQDWLIPLDADEFIDAPDRMTFEAALINHGTCHARVPWIQHAPTAFDDANEINPALRLRNRFDYPTPAPEINPWVWKTFVNVALLAPYLDRYELSRGSHRIELKSLKRESAQPNLPLAGVRLRHYPVRSHDQLLLKGGLGWIQVRRAEGVSPEHSQQWASLSKLCSMQHTVGVDELQNAVRVYLDFGRIDAANLGDTPIIADPFLLSAQDRYLDMRRSPAAALLDWINAQLDTSSIPTTTPLALDPTRRSAVPETSRHTPNLWKSLTQGDEASMRSHYHDKPRTELMTVVGDPGTALLDIGCGAGATALMLKNRFPHCRVTGVELNRQAAAVAAQRLDLVIKGDIETIQLPDDRLPTGGFDTILAADVLEHLANPWHVLLRVRHLLKPGGRLVASIPNVFNLRLLNDLAQGKWHYAADGLLDITHLRFFTAETMQRMLEETGYRVVAVEGLRQRSEEMPPHTRSVLGAISTAHFTVTNQSPQQINQLFNLQHVMVATPA